MQTQKTLALVPGGLSSLAMERAGLWELIKAAAKSEIGYVLLTAFGVIAGAVQVFFALPSEAEVVLFVIGSTMTLLGAAGFGTALGRQKVDENLRLRLEPPYRRVLGLYEGIARVQFDLSKTVVEIADEPTKLASDASVTSSHMAMASRLDEHSRTFDVALAEWRELMPAKVDETRKKLKKEGRLT